MTVEVRWSELARDPKAVAAKVDQGDVSVRRRDGATLRMTREDRVVGDLEALGLAARLLRDVFDEPKFRESVLSAVATELGWTSFLPEPERAIFLDEFARTAGAAADVGTLAPLAQLVREWRATAAVWADPELASQLARSIAGDGSTVPAPDVA